MASRREPNALGYFGYAYYQAHKDQLKVVAVDNGHGCILPSAQTVADGTYQPLSRPLFVYVNLAAAARPEVRAFTRFYLAPESTKYVTKVGYVPLPTAALVTQASRFEKGVTGSALGRPRFSHRELPRMRSTRKRKRGTAPDPCSYSSEHERQAGGNRNLVARQVGDISMRRQVSLRQSSYRANLSAAGAFAGKLRGAPQVSCQQLVFSNFLSLIFHDAGSCSWEQSGDRGARKDSSPMRVDLILEPGVTCWINALQSIQGDGGAIGHDETCPNKQHSSLSVGALRVHSRSLRN